MNNYILLTPGPLTTSETVRQAMMKDWCTWDKEYNEGIIMPIRKELLQLAGVDEENYTTVLLQGSGTYCVEATLGCTVKDTDQLLIFANGAYGDRMGEIARYYNLNHTVITLPETEPVTGKIVEETLQQHPAATHVAVVHCETTTGILNQLEEIACVLKGKNHLHSRCDE